MGTIKLDSFVFRNVIEFGEVNERQMAVHKRPQNVPLLDWGSRVTKPRMYVLKARLTQTERTALDLKHGTQCTLITDEGQDSVFVGKLEYEYEMGNETDPWIVDVELLTSNT